MNNKIISLFFISLFLLSALSTVVADDDDRWYAIDLGEIFITIDENGMLHINESYTYSFHGTYHGVYRDIPLKKGESIDNLNVTVDGAYYTVNESLDDNEKHITVYLSSTDDMKGSITDNSVVVHYSYDFKGVTNIYNDVGELQYKLWGEDWDVKCKKLIAHITFPTNEKIQYWINPNWAVSSEDWSNNTLNIYSTNLAKGEFFEFRGIIPLNEFDNPIYGNRIHSDGYDEIIKIQNDYEMWDNFYTNFFSFVPDLLLISLIIPIYIYFRYGREPKINYNGVYEREPPTKDSPIFVDAFYSSTTEIGDISRHGLEATVMDLINRDIIKLDSESSEKNVILILPEEISNLKSYEKSMIDALKIFEIDGKVRLKDMNGQLSKPDMKNKFRKEIDALKMSYAINHREEKDKIFKEKGSIYTRIYAIVVALLSLIVCIIADNSTNCNAGSAGFISFFVLIICGIIFAIPNRVSGRWTKEGYENYKKWNNFKKYLKDFSLIKQYPPQSIVVWNEYLIYATALGVAREVSKSMKELNDVSDSDVFIYYGFGGASMMSSAILSVVGTSNSGASGAGGGSGGGGGGAF